MTIDTSDRASAPTADRRGSGRRTGLALALATALVMPLSARAETWKIQRGPSALGFTIEHAHFLQVNGDFKEFSGTVVCPDGDFTRAQIDVVIDVGSIYTGHSDRDRSLRHEDFFFAERFPQMRYHSRSVQPLGDSKYLITGDLTIRGVTRPVSLEAQLIDRRTTRRGERIDFLATGRLDRYDFGLRWNDVLEAGGLLVGREVELRLEIALLLAD